SDIAATTTVAGSSSFWFSVGATLLLLLHDQNSASTNIKQLFIIKLSLYIFIVFLNISITIESADPHPVSTYSNHAASIAFPPFHILTAAPVRSYNPQWSMQKRG